jgi:hypothetical protein
MHMYTCMDKCMDKCVKLLMHVHLIYVIVYMCMWHAFVCVYIYELYVCACICICKMCIYFTLPNSWLFFLCILTWMECIYQDMYYCQTILAMTSIFFIENNKSQFNIWQYQRFNVKTVRCFYIYYYFRLL